MKKNKIIFFAVVAVIIFVMFVTIAVLVHIKPKDTKKGASATDAISVWIVGDETAGFSDIISAFKKKNPTYKKAEIAITSFASYEDYEKVLINVIADGHSPDIFVVHNNGGGALLTSKTQSIPDSIIKVDGFLKSFNKVFDELVTEEKGTDPKSGEPVIVQGIRGIPVGFETLGLYYNYKLVKNIPTLWSDIDHEIDADAKADYATMGMGLGGRYVAHASDILSLLLLQSGADTYEKVNDPTIGVGAISGYPGYASDQKNAFAQFKDKMDSLYLTNVDLFARGQVGMILGYPSTLTLIDQAIKRAGADQDLTDRLLRAAPIPQVSAKGDSAVNLVNYSYFALSKYANNPDLAVAFLSYLATSEAQAKFVDAYPYYIPALSELETKYESQSFKGHDRIKINSFFRDGVMLKSFDKGFSQAFDDAADTQLNKTTLPPKEIATTIRKYTDCQRNQYLQPKAGSPECVNN